VDPVPDPLLLIKSGSAENRTRNIWVLSLDLWPQEHKAVLSLSSTGIWNSFLVQLELKLATVKGASTFTRWGAICWFVTAGTLVCNQLRVRYSRNHFPSSLGTTVPSLQCKTNHVTLGIYAALIIEKRSYVQYAARGANSNGASNWGTATCLKVLGSIPDEEIVISNGSIPSSRTADWKSTQTLMELNTKNLSGGKVRPALEADFNIICTPSV
jgi:hypothetical protein